MTSHRFPNATVDQVLAAAEQVLLSADSGDVQIVHAPDRMMAVRRYTMYAVVAASFGTYAFDVTARQQGADVVAQLAISESQQPITLQPVMGTNGSMGVTAGAGIVGGSAIPEREPYDLFFARMESLLGDRPWTTCGSAMSQIDSTSRHDALCFNADDEIPKGVRPPDKKTQPRYCSTTAECLNGYHCELMRCVR